VSRPGPDVAAPFVTAKPKPEYTGEARLARLEGSVLLSLIVGADGLPRDIQVVRSLGLGLDESAVENLRAWQFKAGSRNGSAVDVLVNEEVFFRPQRTLWDWHAVRAVFLSPQSIERPVLIQAKFPATISVEENASVTMTFDVGPRGVPVNLRVVKSSNAKWEAELLRAVSEDWRFRPGYIHAKATTVGKPTTVPAWFEFVRGSHSPIPPLPIPAPGNP
jgi:TonB family protein